MMKQISLLKEESHEWEQASKISFSSLHSETYEELKEPFKEIENVMEVEVIIDKCYEKWGENLIKCFLCLIIDKGFDFDIEFFQQLSISRFPKPTYKGISTSQYNALKVDFKSMAAAVGKKGLFCTMNCKKPSLKCLSYINHLIICNPGNQCGTKMEGVSQRAKTCLERLKMIQKDLYKPKKSRIDKIDRVKRYEKCILSKLKPSEKTSIEPVAITQGIKPKPPLSNNKEDLLKIITPQTYIPLSNNYKIALMSKTKEYCNEKMVIQQLKKIIVFKRESISETNFFKPPQETKIVKNKRPKVVFRIKNDEKVNELILQNKFSVLSDLEEHVNNLLMSDSSTIGVSEVNQVFVHKKDVFSEESLEIIKSIFMTKGFKYLFGKRQKRLRYNLLCWANGYPHEKISSKFISLYLKASTFETKKISFEGIKDYLDDKIDNIITEIKMEKPKFKTLKNPSTECKVSKKRIWLYCKAKRKGDYRFKREPDHFAYEHHRPLKRRNTRRNEPYNIRILPKPLPVVVAPKIVRKPLEKPKAVLFLEQPKTNKTLPLRSTIFQLDFPMIVSSYDEHNVLNDVPVKYNIKDMFKDVFRPTSYKNNLRKIMNISPLNEMAMSNYVSDLGTCDWEQTSIKAPKKLKPKEECAGVVIIEDLLLAINLLILHNNGVNFFSTLDRCQRALRLFID